MNTALEKIAADKSVRLISALAAECGVNVYLAGGGLRDCLLGRRVNDLDFALSGAYIELPRLFAERWGGTFFWLDEERFQARVVKKGTGETLVHDFAPLRGATIEDDLLLRDFTINALAMPVSGGEAHVIDPLQGVSDLRGRLIRACSDHAFDDDPLRLLRALRFAAELGFAVEEGTRNALRQKTALLGKVAAERVRDELFRTVAAPGIGASLERLVDSGLLREIFPVEIHWPDTGGGVEQCRMMVGRQIRHAAQVERVCSELERLLPGTADTLADYLGAEVEGGIRVVSLMKLAAFLGSSERAGIIPVADRLRLGRKAARLLELFCTDATDLFGTLKRNVTERAMYRFFRDREPAGPGLVFIALASGAVANALAVRLLEYFVRDFDAAGGDLLLPGEEVMAVAGIGEGERVGEVMAALREAESHGLVNDREAAYAFVKNLLTKREPLR
jgi:poly(A) polymerase